MVHLESIVLPLVKMSKRRNENETRYKVRKKEKRKTIPRY